MRSREAFSVSFSCSQVQLCHCDPTPRGAVIASAAKQSPKRRDQACKQFKQRRSDSLTRLIFMNSRKVPKQSHKSEFHFMIESTQLPLHVTDHSNQD